MAAIDFPNTPTIGDLYSDYSRVNSTPIGYNPQALRMLITLATGLTTTDLIGKAPLTLTQLNQW
jgi:hypothetical protein